MTRASVSEAPKEDQRPAPRASVETAIPSESEWDIQGIAGPTNITTNFGRVPMHLLRKGDRVRTRSGRYLAVEDIQEIKLGLDFVQRHTDALPVIIPSGAIDGKIPTQDVQVSACQPVTFDAKSARPEMLLAGELPRCRRKADTDFGMVAYYQIKFEETVEVFCDGIWGQVSAG